MPDLSWLEADWVQDLVIANNTVDASYGGIFVGLIRGNDMGSGRYPNHANVSITGNTIVNASAVPLLVTSAHDVIIGGNTVQDCLCAPPNYGQGTRCRILPSCQTPCAKCFMIALELWWFAHCTSSGRVPMSAHALLAPSAED